MLKHFIKSLLLLFLYYILIEFDSGTERLYIITFSVTYNIHGYEHDYIVYYVI